VSDPSREQKLRELEERLGHHFADPTLLDRALTHTSRANESYSAAARHNEPLEFLGDAVLGFIVSDLLHRRDPEGDEGTKSKTRALLVSEPSLARRAEALGIPGLMLLGRGEEKSGGRLKATLWADAYEAVVAALYLDGGLPAALRFVSAEFAEDIAAGAELATQDAKSALQEVLQARGADVPEYPVLAEEGPSHRRRFRVACVVEGRVVAEGEGHSKKEAQQDAARRALALLAAEG
jgi:ribonuclease III